MTNAEARFNKYLRPRKPEGSLGRTAQDVHLDSHTAPELCYPRGMGRSDKGREEKRTKLEMANRDVSKPVTRPNRSISHHSTTRPWGGREGRGRGDEYSITECGALLPHKHARNGPKTI